MIDFFITKYLRWYTKRNLKFDEISEIPQPKWKNYKKLLLYIHIPFCEELCPYCSFNRFKFNYKTAKKYFPRLRKELKLYYERGFDFEGIYVGGGTPTIIVEELCETLNLARELFSIKEISCETNPNHLNEKIIENLLQVKVNRLSVGVQSFDDKILKQIERYHKYGSSKEIQERIKLTLNRFDTLNIDMIFNFPTHTEAHIKKDCEIIKELKVDQVTFYPLMVSESTQKLISKNLGKFSFKNEKKFYYIILSMLEDEYFPSTCWCFSRKKSMIDEYIIDYDEYIGTGSGSFGYYEGIIYSNTFSIKEYIEMVDKNKLPLKAFKKFSEIDKMRYDFLIKLFGTKLDKNFIIKKYGKNFFRKLLKEILFFYLIGGIKIEKNQLSLTRKGLYYWVVMMREFFIGVNNFRDYCRSLINDKWTF